jgi:hypothetical protein
MAPTGEVARKATRTSTPDPRKQKAGSGSVKENDSMNSPDRVKKTAAGKEEKPTSSTATTPQERKGRHQFTRLGALALVVAVAFAFTAAGISMASRFYPEMAKVLPGQTQLLFADVGVHFKHAIDVIGSFDAAEFLQRVLDTTGYFDEAGFFHPALACTRFLPWVLC